ncbi:Zinc/iron permease [Scheffersomyces amazonensis]|uniref:Zinc/iron permease n=1 Tax=Scheffersomyces amazonensis TaxID=1078765 RepID=UPI00315C5C5B
MVYYVRHTHSHGGHDDHDEDEELVCSSGNDYNGEMLGARISSIFVILAASAIGCYFPLIAKRYKFLKIPDWFFFVTRFIGSGVIIGTGFVHLLVESRHALTNPCLGEFSEYAWTEAIALMGIFVMFLIHIFGRKKLENIYGHSSISMEQSSTESNEKGEEHIVQNVEEESKTDYLRIMNVSLLELGIVLHSIFVGLTLAVTGSEFKTLYIAIVFHQFLEGVGLGSRFAMYRWPPKKTYLPWVLSLVFTLSTPISTSIGLGLRNTYPPGSRTALYITGVFDAFCAGIMIYSSLVDLISHDFFYSDEFDYKNKFKKVLFGYGLLAIGVLITAYIGKYA